MPWRLIGIIATFAVFLAFIAFNLDDNYRSDISFGFTVIRNIPVFLTIFTSFAIGFLCAVPFIINARKNSSDNPLKDKKPAKDKPPAEPKVNFDGGIDV